MNPYIYDPSQQIRKDLGNAAMSVEKGFQNVLDKKKQDYDYTITKTIGSNPDGGTARFIARIHLSKVPYDPVLNIYGPEVPISGKRTYLMENHLLRH